MLLFAIANFCLFITIVCTDRILVLVDNLSVKETHSIFLKSLRDRHHELTIKLADDESIALTKYGEKLFDHLIIFAPGVDDFGGTISVREIIWFIDDGGNVLITGGSQIGDAVQGLVAENGFEFDESGLSVIDHLNYDYILDKGDHTMIVAESSQLLHSPAILGEANFGPILFRGAALLHDESNLLRLELFKASTTAYSFSPKKELKEYPLAIGKSVILVAALQARNNARVIMTGSMDMFSDELITAYVNKIGSTTNDPLKPVKSGNLDFVTELSKWLFMEKSVLRVKNATHHKVGESIPRSEYTIMDEVDYSIEIEELNNGKWGPFKGVDVQLEFIRIDPFVRTTLKNENGKLNARFKLPDVYGVFKFVVDYRRIGLTHLFNAQQVSVRPLQHNQYERFIQSAYPYYVSSFSMMIGVLLFSCVFLYHKEVRKDEKKIA